MFNLNIKKMDSHFDLIYDILPKQKKERIKVVLAD